MCSQTLWIMFSIVESPKAAVAKVVEAAGAVVKRKALDVPESDLETVATVFILGEILHS